jgi:hypothetical protein
VSDPHKYDALREEGRKALERQFHDAAAEVAGRQAAPEKQLADAGRGPGVQSERQATAPEPPFMTDEDRHIAARAALTETLDKQVRENKISHHERRDQLYRFENTPSKLDHTLSAGTPAQDQARTSGRPVGATDRADLVSQQAAARERLNASIERNAAGKAPEKTADLSRKPPTIER